MKGRIFPGIVTFVSLIILLDTLFNRPVLYQICAGVGFVLFAFLFIALLRKKG